MRDEVFPETDYGDKMASSAIAGDSGPKGMTIRSKLTLTFLVFILVLAGALALVYLRFVPPLMQEQIELRTFSIAQPLSTSVLEPLATRDYLRVNTMANETANLPGVAYVAVINSRNQAVSGLYGDIERFSPDFKDQVQRDGFPTAEISQLTLDADSEAVRNEIVMGGKRVLEVATPVGSMKASVRVGLFTEDVETAVRNSLIPLLALLGVMAVFGIIVMVLLARSVANPIRKLAEEAHQISIGKLDQEIEVKGGGEIGDLVGAFTRMQASIKYSMEQLKR